MQEIPNKVAMNIALQVLIRELPAGTVKQNYATALDALFHVLNISHDHLVYQVETESRKTLDQFFEKVGVYNRGLLDPASMERELHNSVLDKVISQLFTNKLPARSIAMEFIEKISKLSQLPVATIMQRVLRSQPAQNPMDPRSREQMPAGQQEIDRSWATFLYQNHIEFKSKQLFQLYKGGYSQILNLLSYIELLQFLLKH